MNPLKRLSIACWRIGSSILLFLILFFQCTTISTDPNLDIHYIPKLIKYPSGSVFDCDPISIEWSKSNDSIIYKILINDALVESCPENSYSISTTSWDPYVPYTIQICSNIPSANPCSEPIEVTVIPCHVSNPPNNLVTPDDGLCGTLYPFLWDAIDNVTYECQIQKGDAWIPATMTSSGAEYLADSAGTYSWRVRSLISGLSGEWQYGDSFTVADAAIPPSQLQSPPTNLIDSTFVFKWESNFQDGFECQYAIEDDWTNASVYHTSALAMINTPGTYQWRVRYVGESCSSNWVYGDSFQAASIRLDGYDDEPLWGATDKFPITFSQRWNESNGLDPNILGYYRITVADENLYVFVHIEDQFIHVDSNGMPWTDDGIEIFLDANGDGGDAPSTDDFHLILTPDTSNRWIGKGVNQQWGFTADLPLEATFHLEGTINQDDDADRFWNVELKIPVKSLRVPESSEMSSFGFALKINEDDLNDHDEQHWYDLFEDTQSNTPSSWQLLQIK